MSESEKYPELSTLSDEIMRCGRCGFCQSVCPVYRVTGHESGVARGRTMCARELVSGTLDLSRENEAFFTECLLCRACVESCFSSVKTDEIALAGRRSLRRQRGISPTYKYIFETLLADHRRLGRLIRLVASARRLADPEITAALRIFGWLGLVTAIHRPAPPSFISTLKTKFKVGKAYGTAGVAPAGLLSALKTLRRADELLKDAPREFLRERLIPPSTKGQHAFPLFPKEHSAITPFSKRQPVIPPFAKGGRGDLPSRYSDQPPQEKPAAPTKQAALFIGCGTNFMFPHVGEATIALLETLGYEILIVDHGCCGLPAFTHGALKAAMRLAAQNLRAFSGLRECVLVTDCSSCASFLKDYPRLFALGNATDTALLSEAEEFSTRVRDLTEIIADAQNPSSETARQLNVEATGPLTPPAQDALLLPFASSKEAKERFLRVTFHDPCHLSRYQRLSSLPRMILRSLPGIEFIEMNEADSCCGGAGSFAVEHPDLSRRILDRKIENIVSSNADIVATTCPSCLMQIRSGLAAKGTTTRAAHLAELVHTRLSYPHSKS
ncbi:(Fe-S)-binding protein [Candidatus Poribacteria bacterium]|nr:(Fe-S)-binding protein [Candidatus Poribacteria bacterium]